jgi:hypothetical protein
MRDTRFSTVFKSLLSVALRVAVLTQLCLRKQLIHQQRAYKRQALIVPSAPADRLSVREHGRGAK